MLTGGFIGEGKMFQLCYFVYVKRKMCTFCIGAYLVTRFCASEWGGAGGAAWWRRLNYVPSPPRTE